MIKRLVSFSISLALLSNTALAATEITWWHGMGGKLGDVVNEIANRYNASQADCHLTPAFKGTYEETLTAGIAAFRAGEQPNILQVFDAGSATIINAKGAVIPAQDLLEQEGVKLNPDDYIDGVRNFYADASGKFIGMPFNSSSPIMYFNKEALAKAGVEPPKTWEEFEAIAPKLKDAGYVPLVQSHMPWIFVENFFSRNNVQFASNDNGYKGAEGTKILINTPEIKMHWTHVKDWKDKGWFGFYGVPGPDNQKPFEEGKVALFLASSGAFGGLAKTASMPFGSTFLPYWGSIKGAGVHSFIGGAALFAMSGKAAAENACTAKFFSFLTSPEIQYYWHKETGYVPVTKAAYELAKADGYYAKTPDAETGIKQLSLPGAEWDKGYRMGFYVQIRDVMNREFVKLLNGDESVDAAFATIETDSNALLEKFAKTTAASN
ncbi:extracellular solute-binding protein [Oryzibacter oryziterrae]|uniref:extracellular solute-binding protein n=1 Tax=Oryzibacter oryziterrae TaxID=2766474 RepID=UPI001F1931C7|nr:extracellular solute-binding protein [Oryzibacter oryziterrae]